MINRVKQFIISKSLFLQDDHLLLAISGGPDSLCLFFILKKLGYNIELAHCNFSLRDKESDQDEEFVRRLANKYKLKCHVKRFDTYRYAKSKKVSIQMAARDLRYKWFYDLLQENNLDFIITGHHRDDNIETFLMNLIRGAGVRGLSGIKPKNNKVVRPLLEISKKEIKQFLVENNIEYRYDRSNLDVKYLRNKIRKKIIPLLKEINPNIQQTITDEIFILDGIGKIFNERINTIKERLIREKDGVYKLNIADLIKLDHLEIILFEILNPFGFFQVSKIINTLDSQSGKQFFSETHQLIVDREKIIISERANNQEEIEITDVEIQIETPLNLRFTTSFDPSICKKSNIARLDFDKISFPLTLRKWRNGDRFKPLGMRNFKKLSDFFIDEKYSILDKQKQWILCSNDDIVWIVGSRIDDRYKIEDNTKKVYIAELLTED